MSRLALLWSKLLYTLWFVPSLLVLASAGLAVAMVELSVVANDDVLARWPRLFGAGAEGSRGMLSSIAGSMITVAGVTFSITMVAVTQASSQYSPRILRNFMRDSPSQFVLGGLTGVFTYCLIVLRTIRGGDEEPFVPAVAVLFAFLLAALGVGLLIYFVHHMATVLQVATIVERLSDDTIAAVDALFPSEVGQPAPEAHPPALQVTDAFQWHPVPSGRSGYLQNVDPARLLDAAVKHDVVVRMEYAVGDFVARGEPLASVAAIDGPPPQQACDDVADAYMFGSYRTVEQDPGFGIRQLVDIAVRALSPGVNDPTTALNCVDYLGAIIARAATRQAEPAWRRVNGAVRVIAKGPTFEHLMDSAFDGIRRYGEAHIEVMMRQLDSLAVIARATRDPGRRRHVLLHVNLIAEASERSIPSPSDRGALLVRIAELRAALGAA